MSDVILYKEDVDRLNFLLRKLVGDAKLLSALLITKDTRVLACQGTFANVDTGALAALLVGSFASTQAIAGLIGETEFDTMSHCGKMRNVIISLIDGDTILASIFDKNSSVDRILSNVAKHLDGLKKALHSIGDNTTHDLFDTGSSETGIKEDNEFEIRTDMLCKNAEGDLPLKSSETSHRLATPPTIEHETLEYPSIVQHLEKSQKQSQTLSQQVQSTTSPPEIKRPPDTKMIEIEPIHPLQTEERARQPHTVHAGHTKDQVEDAPQQPSEIPLTAKNGEPSIRENGNSEGPRPLSPSPEKKNPQQSAKNETAHVSMNYLKNKAREGALYYHYDKAFFKKFFKSSHKKKI